MEHAIAGKKGNLKENTFADSFPVEVLPFEEAINYLQTKIPLSKKAYYDLDDSLRFRAFTVGRLNDADAMHAVQGIIKRGLTEGATLKDYYNWTDEEILGAIGFAKGEMSYWETVYRTNIQTCYNTGRAMGFEAVPPIALELCGVEDQRQSQTCRDLTTPPFIKPYGDPVWKYLWPPFHFKCRTTVRGIYDKEELSELGGTEAVYSTERDALPQKGFGGYPLDKESYWRLTPEMTTRAQKYGIDGEIVKAALELDMRSYGMELLKGYSTLVKTEVGGYVKLAANYERSGKEIDAAQDLAKKGHQVYLLPRTHKAKSADMIIDGEIGEIKHQEKPGKKSITSEITEAGKKQRSRVVDLHVRDETTQEEIEQGLWEGINRTPIKKVLLSWQGKNWELPRSVIMDKNWKLP